MRGFLTKDTMSQYEEHEVIHANHPNLVLVVEDGSHVEGAIIANKIARYQRVAEYLRQNDMSILGMKPEDYLPADQEYVFAD